MKTLLVMLLATVLPLGTAGAAVCKGESPCKACATCRECKYCNTGKGSCNVKREQADRDYAARKRPPRQSPR